MSEKDAIDKLRERGFTLDFVPVEGGLRCVDNDVVYAPEDCRIVETFRFEGVTDLNDEALVCAIETSAGSRGVLVDGYGPQCSAELAAILDRIPVERTSPKQPPVDPPPDRR